MGTGLDRFLSFLFWSLLVRLAVHAFVAVVPPVADTRRSTADAGTNVHCVGTPAM